MTTRHSNDLTAHPSPFIAPKKENENKRRQQTNKQARQANIKLLPNSTKPKTTLIAQHKDADDAPNPPKDKKQKKDEIRTTLPKNRSSLLGHRHKFILVPAAKRKTTALIFFLWQNPRSAPPTDPERPGRWRAGKPTKEWVLKHHLLPPEQRTLYSTSLWGAAKTSERRKQKDRQRREKSDGARDFVAGG